MPFPRSSGILLHPTSLPSPYGIGDLGLGAYNFIDFLRQTEQHYWQILPLGPTGYGNSPYMCYSAIAGNPLLISPELLVKDELLTEDDLADTPAYPLDRVDYTSVITFKETLLTKAFDNFIPNQDFTTFCQNNHTWLDGYALYMSLREEFKGLPWYEWAPEIAQRQPEAIAQWREKLAPRIEYHQFLQFIFSQQWHKVKKYANDANVEIIGDIPIYVAHDSADVWAHPDIFCLDPETGLCEQMAGVPPDYFSETGQLWGNPVYNWDYLMETNFDWWIKRFENLLKLVDIIRIDHFRGFESYWSVPFGETTAIKGEWVNAPGVELFNTLNSKLGRLPIVAEDLGIITPEVEALRNQFQFPGMKVLQFAFGSDPGNPFLPFNYDRNFIVYTGTHDNNTTIGWYTDLGNYERDNLLTHIGSVSNDGINWDLIRLALNSVANICIMPLQDILGLDENSRMNMPGTTEGNWEWRYHPDSLTLDLTNRLSHLTIRSGRKIN
jgi:4-alpha-glucanotransferase